MHCPYCRNSDSRVIDSRATEDGTAIRRRRQCQQCNARFTTVETVTVSVTKRNGVSEPFSRDKVLVGVRKACQGRPVDEDDLALLAQRVEEAVRATGAAEVASHDVGLAVLEPLRALDEVAYLRYASVYRAFESLDDFEAEISLLRAEHDLAAPDPVAAELPAAVPAQARTAVDKSRGAADLSVPGAPSPARALPAQAGAPAATGRPPPPERGQRKPQHPRGVVEGSAVRPPEKTSVRHAHQPRTRPARRAKESPP